MSIKKKHEKLLDYLTIAKAADGDAIAMEAVMRHYRPYMRTLAKREPDEHGRAHVDEDMMRRLEAKLAAKVLLFRTE